MRCALFFSLGRITARFRESSVRPPIQPRPGLSLTHFHSSAYISKCRARDSNMPHLSDATIAVIVTLKVSWPVLGPIVYCMCLLILSYSMCVTVGRFFLPFFSIQILSKCKQQQKVGVY